MERTCAECKERFEINKENINQVISFENNCYHHNCFIKMCERKSKNSRALPKWGEALDNINEIKRKSNSHLMNEIYKDDIFEWILENYDIKVVPNKIFTKLSEIYNGTYKGLACSIPPEDILDMWKRKMNFLKQNKARNIAKGKEMDVAQQVNYDISILLNKYDSYLKWKEQNKIIEQDVNKVHKDILQTVDLDKLSKITQNQKKEEDDDMDSLLEELFD